MRTVAVTSVLGLCVALSLAQNQGDPAGAGNAADPKPNVTAETATSPLNFTMKSIDDKEVPLSKYKGDVLLIVNVASKCGYTPQYEQLEAIYKKYADRGLRIAAFPANNFAQQEPGTNPEIKQFCTDKFGVTFDLFSKVSVKGDDTCELYKYLTSEKKDAGHAGEIKWNFTKFLVGRDGKVLARFEPKVKPDDPDVVKALEEALNQKPPQTHTPKPAEKP